MSEPRRVQLSRAKGWRKPDNTVIVARPSRWGNPFQAYPVYRGTKVVCWRVQEVGWRLAPRDFIDEDFPTRIAAIAASVDLFALHIGPMGSYEPDELNEWLARLRGKNLACWCSLDQPCHADVLLELAAR